MYITIATYAINVNSVKSPEKVMVIYLQRKM